MFSTAKAIYHRNRYPVSLSLLALIVALSAIRIHGLAGSPSEVSREHWGLQDFRDAIYFPCRSLAEGHNPYDAKDHMARYPVGQLFPLYSPLTLIIHQPLSWPSYPIARWLNFCVTILLVIVFAFACLRLVETRPRGDQVILLAALILFSRPGHMNLALGQSTLQVSMFCLLALYWSGNQTWRSGWMLALATFKPTFGCLVFIQMLAAKKYRPALTGLLIGCVITLPLIGYICVHAGGSGPFLEILQQNNQLFDGYEGRDPATSFTRLDTYFLICKWFGAKSSGMAELLVMLFLLGASSVVLYFSNRVFVTKRTKANDLASQQLGLCLLLLTTTIAVYHHAYDWLLLVPALTLLSMSQSIRDSLSKPWRHTIAILLAIPAINFASTNTMKSHLDSSMLWPIITSANAIALLLAWLILLAIQIIRLRQPNHLA